MHNPSEELDPIIEHVSREFEECARMLRRRRRMMGWPGDVQGSPGRIWNSPNIPTRGIGLRLALSCGKKE